MANGFVTTAPSSRHGASETSDSYEEYVYAQRFTCPGSGTQNITEIGCYAYWEGHGIRLAIFTDDSGNGCPETMVSNSETTTQTLGAVMAKAFYSYGTEPQLTGGVDYWLAIFVGSDAYLDYLSSSGENTLVYDFGPTWTWPTGAGWESGEYNDVTLDLGIYAVYAAAGTTPVITNAEDETFDSTETDIVVTGTDFGTNTGSADLELGDSATYGSATLVSQSIDSWADTSIQFDVTLGVLDEETSLWLYVTDSVGTVSNALAVTIVYPSDDTVDFYKTGAIGTSITDEGLDITILLVRDE